VGVLPQTGAAAGLLRRGGGVGADGEGDAAADPDGDMLAVCLSFIDQLLVGLGWLAAGWRGLGEADAGWERPGLLRMWGGTRARVRARPLMGGRRGRSGGGWRGMACARGRGPYTPPRAMHKVEPELFVRGESNTPSTPAQMAGGLAEWAVYVALCVPDLPAEQPDDASEDVAAGEAEGGGGPQSQRLSGAVRGRLVASLLAVTVHEWAGDG
jgi:hypothetical protein